MLAAQEKLSELLETAVAMQVRPKFIAVVAEKALWEGLKSGAKKYAVEFVESAADLKPQTSLLQLLFISPSEFAQGLLNLSGALVLKA